MVTDHVMTYPSLPSKSVIPIVEFGSDSSQVCKSVLRKRRAQRCNKKIRETMMLIRVHAAEYQSDSPFRRWPQRTKVQGDTCREGSRYGQHVVPAAGRKSEHKFIGKRL